MRRGAIWLAGLVVWTSSLASPGQARDSSRANVELGYQAQEILHHHCLKCHGDTPKGGLRIFDRTLLVDGRRLIRPGSPEASELFDLVQGGSMPPGNHPKVPLKEQTVLEKWIRAGAPDLPNDHDQSYVLWAIVQDLPHLADKQASFVRYLSLNHLLAGKHTAGDLDRQRKTLEEMLGHLVADDKPAPKLQPIESTGTVFRLDLRDLGWDKHPYDKEAWLNLFDLVLLEYPFGRLPIDSPFYPELLNFLRSTRQVRPVPYVRADWLVHEISRPPLYADFLKVLDKAPNSKPPASPEARPTPSDAAEFTEKEGVTSLRPRGSSHPRNIVADEAKKRRDFWPLFAADRENGIAIAPLDGLTCGEYNTDPLLTVEFKAVPFAKGGQADARAKDKETFSAGERLNLSFKANRELSIKLILDEKLAGENRGETTLYEKVKLWNANKASFLFPKGLPAEAKRKEKILTFTVLAYPAAALTAAQSTFPAGVRLRAQGIHDRVVHRRLYELSPEGRIMPPDPNKMVKVRVHIKILPSPVKTD